YHRYSFSFLLGNFPDYPKLTVWPDAYYGAYRMYSGSTYVGMQACAFERSRMLSGLSAMKKCFQTSASDTPNVALPSDLDGATAPPAGSPNFLVGFVAGALKLWKFHVDWVTPWNSTFNGSTSVTGTGFYMYCVFV